MTPIQVKAKMQTLDDYLYGTCIDRHGPSHSCPFCERPLHFHPKKCAWPKVPGTHKPGYGQRKLAKVQAKTPLFAGDPDVVGTAEGYERRVDKALAAIHAQYRQQRAQGWWRLILWRARANRTVREQLRARLESRWLPHHPEVIADTIFHLSGARIP